MKNVEYKKLSWGEKFSWVNSPLIINNLAIIWDESKLEKGELDEWFLEDEVRRVATVKKPRTIDLMKSGELVFLKKSIKKPKAPFLPNFTIRNFSFDTRDLRIDSRKMTSALSMMIAESVKEATEIERYIGGILHMLHGKIFTLENIDENIITASVFSQLEKDTYVLELFDIVDAFSHSELMQNLLKSNFESYSNSEVYATFLRKSKPFDVLINLGFEEIGHLGIYELYKR